MSTPNSGISFRNLPVVKGSLDHDDFIPDPENRILRNNPRLEASMTKHGFLPECPVVCIRDENQKKWVVRNGCHRLHYARKLGLPIYYIEATKADVPMIDLNNNQLNWSNADYIRFYAGQGNRHYVAFHDFLEETQKFRQEGWGIMGITTAAGLCHYGKCAPGGNAGPLINSGQLTMKHLPHAKEVVHRLAEIHADWDKKETGMHLKLGRGMTQIICALCFLVRNGKLPGFDWARMRRGICVNATTDTFDGNNWQQPLSILQEYYSKHLSRLKNVQFRGVVTDYINS